MGVWDDDLYLDIVHFTERGDEQVAALMFRALIADPGGARRRALRPALIGCRRPGCAPVGKTLDMLLNKREGELWAKPQRVSNEIWPRQLKVWRRKPYIGSL